eukprot:CAMPEP_0115029654 /NCGR_PEP_ID=MMETSP0216-20121206/37157_1 /TAXON_ID=223996 /ORGANISM="Protocruzia adherens, Strain Boccale" /LENGTH=232 /DNA_ID=CAMNT_0002406335 /DNA_START=166 /DNA_END=860 /DNA_ORIENTATION=+
MQGFLTKTFTTRQRKPITRSRTTRVSADECWIGDQYVTEARETYEATDGEEYRGDCGYMSAFDDSGDDPYDIHTYGEEPHVTNFLLERRRYAELMVFIFACLGVGAGILGSDREYSRFTLDQRRHDDKMVTDWCYFVNFGANILAIVGIWVRQKLVLRFMKAKYAAAKDDSLSSAGLTDQAVIESVLMLISPSPFFYGSSYDTFNEAVNAAGRYEINVILSVLQMLIKMYTA